MIYLQKLYFIVRSLMYIIVKESNVQNIQQASPKVVPMSVHYSAAVQRALNFTQASIVTQASSTTGKGTTTFILCFYTVK